MPIYQYQSGENDRLRFEMVDGAGGKISKTPGASTERVFSKTELGQLIGNDIEYVTGWPKQYGVNVEKDGKKNTEVISTVAFSKVQLKNVPSENFVEKSPEFENAAQENVKAGDALEAIREFLGKNVENQRKMALFTRDLRNLLPGAQSLTSDAEAAAKLNLGDRLSSKPIEKSLESQNLLEATMKFLNRQIAIGEARKTLLQNITKQLSKNQPSMSGVEAATKPSAEGKSAPAQLPSSTTAAPPQGISKESELSIFEPQSEATQVNEEAKFDDFRIFLLASTHGKSYSENAKKQVNETMKDPDFVERFKAYYRKASSEFFKEICVEKSNNRNVFDILEKDFSRGKENREVLISPQGGVAAQASSRPDARSPVAPPRSSPNNPAGHLRNLRTPGGGR